MHILQICDISSDPKENAAAAAVVIFNAQDRMLLWRDRLFSITNNLLPITLKLWFRQIFWNLKFSIFIYTTSAGLIVIANFSTRKKFSLGGNFLHFLVLDG